jgi:hypothetical protein
MPTLLLLLYSQHVAQPLLQVLGPSDCHTETHQLFLLLRKLGPRLDLHGCWRRCMLPQSFTRLHIRKLYSCAAQLTCGLHPSAAVLRD